MSAVYRIALLGFSAFERNTLASYFRLAAHRVPRYELVQILTDADYVVADAEHAPSVQLVQATERVLDTVFVGVGEPQAGLRWIARPIDPLHVMRELDAMLAARQPPAPRSQGTGVRTQIQPPRRPLTAPLEADPHASYPPLELDLPAPAPPPPAVPQRPAAVAAVTPSRPGAPPPPLPSALLVDDSEIALRYLQLRLERQGLVTESVTTAVAALALLAKRRFDFVFLDMELGPGSGLDGLGLCQKIKREHAAQVPPTVVMVTAHSGELDRVRGMLAGCDAFLGKPLDDGELARTLSRHGLKLPVAAARP